jgi:uncharacterized membrane protein
MKNLRLLFAALTAAGLAFVLVPISPASAFDPIAEAKKAACKKACDEVEKKCEKECPSGATAATCKKGCKEAEKPCEKKCSK